MHNAGESPLQAASVRDVVERATFDPEWALDAPDVTLFDVGQPLVRRFVEEVRQKAFREEHGCLYDEAVSTLECSPTFGSGTPIS